MIFFQCTMCYQNTPVIHYTKGEKLCDKCQRKYSKEPVDIKNK